MSGPSWHTLRAAVRACGLWGALFCEASSAPAELRAQLSADGGWCRTDVSTPQHALEALLAQALASGAGEGPSSTGGGGGGQRGSPCISPVQGPLLCLHTHSHQDVLHILIKVPPWAGRAPARWLQSEPQGRSSVKRASDRGLLLWRRLWQAPPEAGPLSFQEGKGAWRVAGRWRAHPGVAKAGGSGMGEGLR